MSPSWFDNHAQQALDAKIDRLRGQHLQTIEHAAKRGWSGLRVSCRCGVTFMSWDHLRARKENDVLAITGRLTCKRGCRPPIDAVYWRATDYRLGAVPGSLVDTPMRTIQGLRLVWTRTEFCEDQYSGRLEHGSAMAVTVSPPSRFHEPKPDELPWVWTAWGALGAIGNGQASSAIQAAHEGEAAFFGLFLKPRPPVVGWHVHPDGRAIDEPAPGWPAAVRPAAATGPSAKGEGKGRRSSPDA